MHGLSYLVQHPRGWKSCTFSFVADFVAKTQQNQELSIPSLDDFVGGDRDKLVLSHQSLQDIPVVYGAVPS